MKKTIIKFISSALAVIFLSTPFASIASASSFDSHYFDKNINYKHCDYDDDDDDDYCKHCRKHHKHHDRCEVNKDKDENGNAVTGFIIGAVVGAIVAKNT